MALNHSRMLAGMGAAPVIAVSTASMPTSARDVRERDRVEECPRVELFLGRGAGTLRSLDLQRGSDGLVELLLAFGIGGDGGVDAGVDLLVDAGHAEQQLGVNLAEVHRELVGSGQQ
jgi:hypothetical protein